jgi:hypothetical protein
MKHIKLFESFISRRNPNYKKPEYEFKEFYRVFKHYPELRSFLPEGIDPEIFKVEGTGFDGEPIWLEHHFDPPGRSGEISTDELIEIAEREDPRFIPLIEGCRELFESGRMEKISLENIRKGLNTNFKNHDWDVLQKDPNFLESCEIEYNKALSAGLNDKSLTSELGLVQKYPDIIINRAQFWIYIRESIAHFNRVEESGGQLPCTQFILHNGNYYTIGGRRRMFWHFYNHIDPTVWLIKL